MIKRNQAFVVIMSILTCGIYTYYWIYVTTRDIEFCIEKPDGSCNSPGLAVLFSLLTCGIYQYYWWFKEGKRVAQIHNERGLPPSDNSIVYLLLCFFGLSIVSMVLLQTDMNTIIDRPKMPPAAGDTAMSGNNEKDGFNY